MVTKETILSEVKRTADQNGGTPLGAARFERKTGINSYEWGRHWARFGDVLKAAGFEPNKFQGAHPDEFLIGKLIGIIRKLAGFPTFRDIQAEKTIDPELPDKKVFQRLGTKGALVRKVIEYCKDKPEYDDILRVCASFESTTPTAAEDRVPDDEAGEVYLFRLGRYYKIGRTNDTVRRGRELRIQLPENPRLIHSIKTDDPSGVETYWRNRFHSKMMNTESEFTPTLFSRSISAFRLSSSSSGREYSTSWRSCQPMALPSDCQKEASTNANSG